MVIKGRCLECGSMSMGLPLVVDPALALIRFIKSKANWGVQKEQVIICSSELCRKSHEKKLSRFHRSLALYVGVGLVLGFGLIFAQYVWSRLSVQTMFSGLVIILVVSGLCLFNYYPDVEGKFNV